MNALVTLLAEPWAQRLGWVLIHFLWQGTGIAFLLALVLRLIAQATSHVRYLVIGGALLACGVTPVATWIALGSHAEPTAPFLVAPTSPSASQVEAPVAPALHVTPDVTPTPQIPLQTRWQDNLGLVAHMMLPYVVSLWFGGVLILTLRLTWSWALMQRLRWSGSPIQDLRCLERFEQLLARMEMGVPVRLLQSALVEVPTLIGWLRPTILLPASVFIGLTPDQLDAILAHELAHVRRYDYLVNLFQTAIEIILFYHPAVWWISRKLREERENCCDDLALQVAQDRLIYASALAQLEEGRVLPLAMTASGGSLLQRIRRIAGAHERKTSAWPLWILIGGILSLACMAKLKASEDSTPTAEHLITQLGRFVEGIDSMDYSETKGDPKGDHSSKHWQEMGKLQRIEFFTTLSLTSDGKRGGSSHKIFSYDGDYGYMYSPGSDRLFRQRAPFLDLTEGYYSGLIGTLQPFQFLEKRGERSSSGSVTLQTLKSPEALSAAAARATLDPARNRAWEGHPCLAVKISDGNDAGDSQARVDFVAYFAKDLNFYPIAYEIYKHGKITQSYWVVKLATLPVNKDGSQMFRYPELAKGFRYDSDTYHSSSGGGYSFELTANPDLKINTLAKADFTIAPPAGGYIEDRDTQKLIKTPARQGQETDASPTRPVNHALAKALIAAAQQGDLAEVSHQLQLGADPNANEEPEGQNALFTAAVGNRVDVVKVLLQNKADPNRRNSCGNAPIDWVLDQGHLEMATVLHDAGAKISPAAWAGATGDLAALKSLVAAGVIKKGKTDGAMKYAVSMGHLDAVNFLADIEGKPVAGKFLAQAAQSGNIPMMQFIVERSPNFKADSGDALDQAVIFYDQTESVKWLLAHGADANRFSKWQDYLISEAKSAAMVKVLLDAGANPNVESIFGAPLSLAPDRASVQLLVQHGANLKPKLKNGLTLVESVISRGLYDKPEVVDELIKQGAQFDPKTDGVGALARAAWLNQVKTMQILLDHGVDPNGYCDEPYMQTSVLRNACFNTSPDAVRLLLAHGANPLGDARDQFSPLTFALMAGQWESADLLRKAGAHDVGPLSIAAAKGDVAQATELLKNGGNVDESDRTGNTPLCYAVRRGQLEVAQLLLEHGANINLFDHLGLTAKSNFDFMAASVNPMQAQMDWGVSQDEGKRLIAAFKELFAKYPTDPNYRDSQGRTLLHQMASTGNTMLDMVVDDKAHPVDVNTADKNGNTALLLAATSPIASDTSTRISVPVDGSPSKMKEWNAAAYNAQLLIHAGAKLNLKLTDGQTIGHAAMTAAVQARNPQLIAVLQDALDGRGSPP